MKYTKSSYINTFPKSVYLGIRKSIASNLSKENGYVDWYGDYVRYSKLTSAQKSEVLDDICCNRLGAVEGLNYQYWLDKANKVKRK